MVVTGENFERHLKREHHLSPTDEVINEVKVLCASKSPYLSAITNELLPPISILPVYNGYKCSECPYYCEVLRRMEDHQSDSTHDGIDKCFVQRLPMGNATKFFGVTQLTSLTDFGLSSQQQINLVNVELKRLLIPSTRAPSNWKEQSIFYSQMGWHRPNEADPFPYVYEYSKIPERQEGSNNGNNNNNSDIADSDYELFEAFRLVYSLAMDSILDFDVSTRNRIKNGKETKVFTELEAKTKVSLSLNLF